MEDKIYFKTRYDGLWESSPHKAFSIGLCIYLLAFFSSMVIMTFLHIPGFIIGLFLVALSVAFIVRSLLVNNSKNMSKSTAFIDRDGVLYALQLLYAKKDLGTETDREIIYMSSDYSEEVDRLDDETREALIVQACEAEVIQRRSNIASFSNGLDDVLDYIQKNPKRYNALCDEEKSKLDWWFLYNTENAGMTSVSTQNANYNFLILDKPEIVEETDKYFKVSFRNKEYQLCTSKFTNCYENLIEDIKSGKFNF